jgi:hypothetical protein
MAATAWALYNKAKKKIGNGTIQLGVNTLKMQLHTSASNASTATLSTAASVNNEVANGNGYATGGATLGSVTWTTGASASQYRLDAADPVWTATGGTIPNIKFAVIKNSAGQAICWSKLTTAQFTLAQNNTLTVQFAATGIFTLA